MGATAKLTGPRIRLALVVSVLVLATACGSGTVQPPQATPPLSGSEAAAPDDPLVAQLTGEVTDSGAMTYLQDVVMIGAQLDPVPAGQGSDENSAGPSGSAVIGRELADQLARTGVKPELIRFVGDDEASFIKADIPVGGAENGDAEEKTAEQAKDWGGQPANPTTAATTKRAIASTTSTGTRSTTTCGRLAGTLTYFATPPVNRADTPGTTSSRCLAGRVAARSRRPSGPHDHRRRAADGTTAQ